MKQPAKRASERKLRPFVVYETWTRARVVLASSQSDALEIGEPAADPSMPYGPTARLKAAGPLTLSNWHAVALPEATRLPRSRRS